VSRFAIDADLGQALKKSKWTIDSYRLAVDTYRNAESKEQKREMERLITSIKSDFRSEITKDDPKLKRLSKLNGELFNLTNQDSLFEMEKKQKALWTKQIEKLTSEIKRLDAEIEEIKANKIYENAFEWRFEFPEVLNDVGDFVGFDVVIGNPPYIRQEELKDYKTYFKSQFELYTGTADIYIFFIEKGFKIMKNKGVLSFILPNKFMQAGYGQPARKFLIGQNILEIIDFGDYQIFEEATTYPCILSGSKEKPSEIFYSTKIKSNNFFKGFSEYILQERSEFKQSKLSEDTWVISSSGDQFLLERILANSKTLGEYCYGVAKRGILTGLTEAFVIDGEKANSIIQSNPKNKNHIYPFLLGREIKPYLAANPSNFLIKFEKGFTKKNGMPNPEEWFKNEYPEIFNHLKEYKDKAKTRTDKGEYYWELRACDYYDKFGAPKIMYQKFQVKPCFIFDENGTYCNDSMWIIPTDDKVLLGILNSKMGWWLISKYCTAIQNGYQLIWKYFSQIPIATGDEETRAKIKDLVETILEVKKEDSNFDVSEMEREVDRMVYQLYELNEEEINCIESSK